MLVPSLPHKHLPKGGLFVTAVALVGLGRAALGRLPRCKLSSCHAHIPVADHFALVADQHASYQAPVAATDVTTATVTAVTARGAAAADGRTTAAAAATVVTAASSVVVVSTAAVVNTASASSSTNSAAAARHFHTTNPRRAVPSHGAPPDRPAACSGDTTCRLLLLLTPTVDTNTWIAHITYTYTTKLCILHNYTYTIHTTCHWIVEVIVVVWYRGGCTVRILYSSSSSTIYSYSSYDVPVKALPYTFLAVRVIIFFISIIA